MHFYKDINFEDSYYLVTDKVVDVDVALDVIKDGDVIAVSGFNMAITPPEYLLIRLYDRYRETGIHVICL